VARAAEAPQIITTFSARGSNIAITFEVCEAATPAHLDEQIVAILHDRRVPYTVFLGGEFARDNTKAVHAHG
jgi:hypothetical protein